MLFFLVIIEILCLFSVAGVGLVKLRQPCASTGRVLAKAFLGILLQLISIGMVRLGVFVPIAERCTFFEIPSRFMTWPPATGKDIKDRSKLVENKKKTRKKVNLYFYCI